MWTEQGQASIRDSLGDSIVPVAQRIKVSLVLNKNEDRHTTPFPGHCPATWSEGKSCPERGGGRPDGDRDTKASRLLLPHLPAI